MISSELIIKLHKAGGKFFQLPVDHFPRIAGEATGANAKVLMRAFKEFIILAVARWL